MSAWFANLIVQRRTWVAIVTLVKLMLELWLLLCEISELMRE